MARFNQGDTFHSRYELQALIGMGGFAEVWKASDTITETTHAIKIFAPDKGLNENGIELFKKDYKLTSKLRHTSLLTATHFDIYDDSPYLVMPICEKGSLENKLRQGVFSEEELAKMIAQVADGLAYMHAFNPPLVHRDIKTDNVLMADDGSYLITDFGISSQTKNSLRKATSTQHQQAISVSYAPPERFQSPPVSVPAGDVFSLGVMIYELCVGDVPWEGNGGLMLNKGAAVPQLPPAYPNRLNAIVQACMCPDYQLRPTAAELRTWAKKYQEEQIWPALPKKYATALPSNEEQSFKASNRKTQRMEDIELPQTAAHEEMKDITPPAPKPPVHKGEAKSDDNPSGGMGKVLSLVALFIILAGGLYFGSSYFSEDPANPNAKKTAMGMLNDTSNNNTSAEKVNETEDSIVTEDAAPLTSKKNANDVDQKSSASVLTPKPVKKEAVSYARVGSLEGILERLGTKGLEYKERVALKKEMMDFFASTNAVVLTQVGGVVENAEEAKDFASRIITLPAPKIKIIETEKSGNKVSKLVIEVD